MNKKNKKMWGIIAITVGIIGLFVPGIQGIALIIVGLGLLGYRFSKKKVKK